MTFVALDAAGFRRLVGMSWVIEMSFMNYGRFDRDWAKMRSFFLDGRAIPAFAVQPLTDAERPVTVARTVWRFCGRWLLRLTGWPLVPILIKRSTVEEVNTVVTEFLQVITRPNAPDDELLWAILRRVRRCMSLLSVEGGPSPRGGRSGIVYFGFAEDEAHRQEIKRRRALRSQ